MLNRGIFGLALAAMASMVCVAHAVPVDDASFMPAKRDNNFLFGPQALAQSFTIENTGELVNVVIDVTNDSGGTVTLVFEVRDETGLFNLSLDPLASTSASFGPGIQLVTLDFSLAGLQVTAGDVYALVQPGTATAPSDASWSLNSLEVNSGAPPLYTGGKAYKAQSNDPNTVQPINGGEADFHFLVRVEPAIAVPAPASALLLGVGLVALGGITRHRRR